MKQAVFISLCAGLAWAGCSKKEDAGPKPNPNPLPGRGEAVGGGGMGTNELGAKPGGGLAEQTNNVGVATVTKNNDVPVLAELGGRYYEVFQLAEKPFSGKVVMRHADGITPASEKIYNEGLLMRHTEWHANSAKKMEALLQPSGEMKTAHFDEQGKPIKPPVKIVTAVGRGIEWTKGFGQSRTRIDGYKGQRTELIKRVFGDPDEDLDGVWVYKGMKVRVGPDAISSKLMTTVRFVIQDEMVLDVSMEP